MWDRAILGSVLLVALVACAGDEEHAHADDATPAHPDDQDHPTDHTPRDVAAQPCTLESWQRLLPDLRQCDLAGAALGGVSLRRANLTRAILRDVSAERADLFRALLVEAKAARSNLAGANLTSADLTGADLTGADLRGARLVNATLTDAQLEGAQTDATTTCVSGAPGPCW